MTIDKSQLYETFHNSLRRSNRLTDLATRKALDLPLDDQMQIITHNRPGLGRCGTLLLSLTMLLGGSGAALGVMSLLNEFQRNAPPPLAASQEPPIQEFEVTFWSEDGKHLEVQEHE